MANEVTKKSEGGAAVAGLAGLASGLKRSRTTRPTFALKGYLKMGKDGEWAIGKNGDALNGERALFNPMTLMEGFAEVESTQKTYKVHDEVLMLVTEGSVSPDDLDETPHEWKFHRQIQGRMLSGDQQNWTYGTHSYGGLKALEGVTDAIEARLAEGEGEYIFPVVELQSDWYEHDDWGKTYEPVLEVIGWANVDGVLEGAETKKVTKKAKPEKEEAKEEEAQPEVEDVATEEEQPQDGGGQEADEPPVRRRRRR